MQPMSAPTLVPATSVYSDLINLPVPAGKITAAVYGFRDQTGQYKQAPDSNLSSAVTQGGASILLKAMKDSGWFIPVEREGLQNLLTERKVVRALETPQNTPSIQLPNLLPASLILEGGILSYESNVRTGGKGLRYLGIGLSGQYRVDQVTVNLRAVDVRTGQVFNSVSTTKTIYSKQVSSNVYRFVSFKGLLEADAGYTENEPAQLCVTDAIQAALIHLIAQGTKEGIWKLKIEQDAAHPVLKAYLAEQSQQIAKLEVAKTGKYGEKDFSQKWEKGEGKAQ